MKRKRGCSFEEYKSVIKTFFFFENDKAKEDGHLLWARRGSGSGPGGRHQIRVDQQHCSGLSLAGPQVPGAQERGRKAARAGRRQLPPAKEKKKKKPAPPIVSLRKEMFMNVKLNS